MWGCLVIYSEMHVHVDALQQSDLAHPCRAVRRSNCFHEHQYELVEVNGGDGSLMCHVSVLGFLAFMQCECSQCSAA